MILKWKSFKTKLCVFERYCMKNLPAWWTSNKEPCFEWLSLSCFQSITEWFEEYKDRFIVDETTLSKEFGWVLSKSREDVGAISKTKDARIIQNIEQELSEKLAGACLRMLKERELNELFIQRRLKGLRELFACHEKEEFAEKMQVFLESNEGLLGWLKDGCFNERAANVACEVCELGYQSHDYVSKVVEVALRSVKVENQLNLDGMYRLAFGDEGLIKMFDQSGRYQKAAEVGGLRFRSRTRGLDHQEKNDLTDAL